MVGLRLAASGAIKDELLDFGEVALFVARYMLHYYPEQLKDRFKVNELPEDGVEMLEIVGKKRGCMISGGQIDYDKASEIFLRELRSGKLGTISLERPIDWETDNPIGKPTPIWGEQE